MRVSANGRKIVLTVVGVSILGLLVSQLDFRELGSRLMGADRRWIVAAYGFVLVATGIRSARYAVYFPAPGRRSHLFGAFAFMRALNTAMPLRSGEVAFVGLLKRLSLAPSISEVAPVWVALRTTDLIAAMVWCVPLALTAPFALPLRVPAAEVLVPGLVVVAVALGAVGMFVVPRVLRADRLQQYLTGVRLGVGRLRGKRDAVKVMLLSLAIWFFLIAFAVALLQALDAPVTVHEGVVVAGIMTLITMLPIHGPLGLGTGDGAWASVLTLAGLPFSLAVAVALGIRILSLGLVAVDGIVGGVLIRRAAFGSSGKDSR